jgi:tetratricopeptide (TPR) repeat protein
MRVVNFRELCEACAGEARTRATMLRVGVGTAVVAGLAGLFTWLMIKEPAFDHREHTAKVRELRAALKAEPCDERAADGLAGTYNKAGDWRGTIRLGEQYLQQCKPFSHLYWLTHYAKMQVQDFDGAWQDADYLVKDDPDDGDFWWWRGTAAFRAGRFDDASRDHRQAFALTNERSRAAPFDLAEALAAAKRPCAAAEAVARFADHNPEKANQPAVAGRLVRFERDGDCTEGTLVPALHHRLQLQDHAPVPARLEPLGHVNRISKALAVKHGLVTEEALSQKSRDDVLVMVDGRRRMLRAVPVTHARLGTENPSDGGLSTKDLEFYVDPSLPDDALVVARPFLARFEVVGNGKRAARPR